MALDHPATALAATIHDPDGLLDAALPRLAGPLRETFATIALNISAATDPRVNAAAADLLGAIVMTHAPGLAIVGRARRDSVRLALASPHAQILYCDFDHMARWIETGPADLHATLADQPATDLLIVGRSPRAFAAEPKRLQETEAIVNRIYAQMTGREADLMFAVRRLSRRAAEAIVHLSSVDTVGNDVEWPLLAEREGLSVGAAKSGALFYRTMEEFGAPADTGDDDPALWMERIDYAAAHVAAMRPFLKPKAS